MEHFKEPKPEPDTDSPMHIPPEEPEEHPVSPDPDVPMTSLFISYQPSPKYTQNPSYELCAREQPTTPWQEVLSQGHTLASKRSISPMSKVSTPKHYQDSAGRSKPVTPARSIPSTLIISVPNTNLRYMVELPFGSTPVPAIAELPETTTKPPET